MNQIVQSVIPSHEQTQQCPVRWGNRFTAAPRRGGFPFPFPCQPRDQRELPLPPWEPGSPSLEFKLTERIVTKFIIIPGKMRKERTA